MAYRRIIEKPTREEFLVVELMGFPGQESLYGVVGREPGLQDDSSSSRGRVCRVCRINKEMVRPLRGTKIRYMQSGIGVKDPDHMVLWKRFTGKERLRPYQNIAGSRSGTVPERAGGCWMA